MKALGKVTGIKEDGRGGDGRERLGGGGGGLREARGTWVWRTWGRDVGNEEEDEMTGEATMARERRSDDEEIDRGPGTPREASARSGGTTRRAGGRGR